MRISWELCLTPEPTIAIACIRRRWNSGDVVPRTQQLEILRELRLWLRTKGLHSDIEQPPGCAAGSTKCMWADCPEAAIGTLAICARHFDAGFLEQ